MKMAINGIGPVFAGGSGIEKLGYALNGYHQAPDPESIQLQESDLSVLGPRPEGLEKFYQPRALRRVDEFSRMALLSASLALKQSRISPESSGTGVVFGSGYGPLKTTFNFLDTIIEEGDGFASPQHFASSVHNAPASHISALNHFQGPCATITTFGQTVAGVLSCAQDWLSRGEAEHVLAGFGDELCDVLHYTVSRKAGSLQKSSDMLSLSSCAYLPGGGAVSLVLAPEKTKDTLAIIELTAFRAAPEMVDPHFLGDPDGIILSARGLPDENRILSNAYLKELDVTVYTRHYGASPVSAAFDISAAVLCLEAGMLYPPPMAGTGFGGSTLRPISEAKPLTESAKICVVEPAGAALNIYTISRF